MSNSHETLTDPTTGKPRISWLAWLLWLTTLAGLYLIRHDVEKRDAEIQRSQKALTLLIERVGKTMSPLDSNKRVAAVAVQEANLLPEASNIEDALRLAEKSKSAGNTELALVYLANAIRSQPRDIHVLSKYTTWALDSKNPTVIQGAENLLQGALYGVSAKDVLEVTGRLEEVSKALAVQQAPLDAPSGHDLEPAKSFAELEKVTLESFSGDRKKIETRIEALSVVVEQINEADQPDSKLKDQVGQRLAEAQAYAMADQVLSLAELRFNNLAATETLVATEPSDNNRTAALAALQATEAAVNQIWSVPLALVSQELKAKLIMLPEKLKTKAGTIQNTVEKEDIKKAQNEWENRDYRDWNIIQYRIDGCQTASEKCSEILSKLQGPDSRKDAADLYKKMSGEMKRLKEQQLAAYQKWAVDQIEAARRRYESAKVGHWDIDAFSAFYETEFQEIDQRFLTPDVDQFLQGVFSILCNKLNAEGKAQLQREMAFPSLDRKPKRSLEKF